MGNRVSDEGMRRKSYFVFWVFARGADSSPSVDYCNCTGYRDLVHRLHLAQRNNGKPLDDELAKRSGSRCEWSNSIVLLPPCC